jgi:hypothetical protein
VGEWQLGYSCELRYGVSVPTGGPAAERIERWRSIDPTPWHMSRYGQAMSQPDVWETVTSVRQAAAVCNVSAPCSPALALPRADP